MQLVIAPGLGLDRRSLRDIPARIEESGTPVEVIHLPAMGERGIDRVGESAKRLVEKLGKGPVALLGHSASCQVVARAGRELDLRGLVLIGPTTDPQLRSWPALIRAWAKTISAEPLWQIPHLLPQYLEVGPVNMMRAMNRMRHERIEEDLGALNVPTLVLRGEDDRIATREWTLRCAQAGGEGSKVRILPGAHMIPHTHPEQVAREVSRFLAEIQERELDATRRP